MSTKKILSAITTLAVVVMMIAPIAPVGAATADELAKSIADATALLNSLTAQLGTMQSGAVVAPVVSGTACAGITFSVNLTIGSRGNDVKCLQTILNASADTQVAASGVGSYGSETTYFGALTKVAVVKYQAKNSISPAVGFVGPITRAKLNLGSASTPATPSTPSLPAGCASAAGYSPTTGQSCGTAVPAASTTPITGEGLKVSVAANTPVTNTVIIGSEATAMLNITLANGNNTAVKVTKIRLKRSGISGDTSLGNIYLFDGYSRLSDEATLSSGYATFNKASGIMSIPAGTTKTISVRAQIPTTASAGETVNLSVEAATDITSDASAVSGTFPLTGNTMSIAAATSKATVNFTLALPTTPSTADYNAANNSIVWQNNFATAQQDVKIEYIKFSQIGSVAVDALANIRLDMNGVTLATGQLVASDVGQDLVFDLSAAPVAVVKGLTKQLTIYADVIKGSSKTIRMSIEKSADIFIKDAAYGNYVLITSGSNAAFVPMRAGIMTVNVGTVTVTKRTDSPTTGGVLGATNVSLAKFDIKASGEDVKVNSLNISGVVPTNANKKYLRNVSIYLDGVQVGNTANIETNNSGTTNLYSTVNIYQILTAGTAKVLEVKGDIYGCTEAACTTANGFAAAQTVQIKIEGATTFDNAQGMTSLSMVDAPASDVSGNLITIGSGSLTAVKSAGYGNQTTAAGRDTKIGQYSITAAQYDIVNISSMSITVTDTGTALAADMSNLYIKYSGSGITGVVTSNIVGSMTTAVANVFSTPIVLPANGTLTVEVYAMINTTAISGDAAKTRLAITASRATDGGDAGVGIFDGQTITIANGSLSVTKINDPVAALVVGNTSDVLISKYTWSSNYEPFTVTDIKIEATTSPSDTSDDYNGIYLKYKDASGSTVTSAIMTLTNGTTTFTNQTLYVAANGTAIMEVYGNMNSVGAGFANGGDRPQLGLYYYKATSGSTSSAEVTYNMGAAPYGNAMVLYASKPTVSLSGTSGTLAPGVNALYAATIAADAQGAVGLKKLTFSVSPSMSSSTGDTIGTFTLYRGNTDITSLVSIRETTTTGTDLTSGNLTSVIAAVNVVVLFTDEEEIQPGSSQTYTLKANVTGVGTVGESITSYLKKDAAYAAPAAYDAGTFNGTMFAWTDQSVLNHAETTADWNNGFLVKTLDSPSYTISK